MQVYPPITFTLFSLGSKVQRLLQEMKVPQPAPLRPPNPTSKYVRSQLESTTQLLLPSSREVSLDKPHQWITSSFSTGRSRSRLAQYIAFLAGLIFLHSSFCLRLQYTSSSKQLGILLSIIHCLMLGFLSQQLATISSPPKCTQPSGNRSFTSFMTLLTTSQVRLSVGSNCPWYSLLHFTMIYLRAGDRPQLSVWAGVSNSGMMRTPRTLAQFISCLMSSVLQVPENWPYWASSGRDCRARGKLSSSVMCQCSTLILLYMSASIWCLMASSGRKCREESSISPLWWNMGVSSMRMGLPLMMYWAPLGSNSWKKVSRPLRNPTQVGELSSHSSLTRTVSEYCSSPFASATIRDAFLMPMLSLMLPGATTEHLNTLTRQQPIIYFTQVSGTADTVQLMLQGSTSRGSAVQFRDRLVGIGHSSLVWLFRAEAGGWGAWAGSTTRVALAMTRASASRHDLTSAVRIFAGIFNYIDYQYPLIIQADSYRQMVRRDPDEPMHTFFCDYCGVDLTNRSPRTRKQHNDGRRHKENMVRYYRQVRIDMEEQLRRNRGNPRP